MRPPRGLRRHATPLGAAAALALLAAVAAGAPAASGGFSANLTNSTDTAGTANHFTCQTAIAADRTAALFQWPLADATGSTSANDVSGNARTGTYVGSVVADGTAPLGCRRDGGSAWRLDGTTSAAYYGTRITNPQTFTVEATFQTTVKGGKIIGFGNNSTTPSGNYDRHVYVGSDGTLVFGVYNGGYRTITSTQVVTDGAWHHVAATLSSAGMKLYLDGRQVAANAAAAYTAAENTNGYWHVGYDTIGASWPKAPTSAYFSGRLRNAAVYTVELSAQQIADHAAPTF